MLRKIACLALAASALVGCIIVAEPAGTVEVHGRYEPHGHAYIYFPGYHAYYCTAHDDWWWIDGGRWTYVTVRPSHIHVDAHVAWVHVDDDDGPEPYRRFDDHCRDYPRDWRPAQHAGPPPGKARGSSEDSGPGNRGRGNAWGHDRQDDRERGGGGGPEVHSDDPQSRGGDAEMSQEEKEKQRERDRRDRQAREAEERGGSDGDAGKPKDAPKEKANEKKRGRDKDKEKSRGKGGEGDGSGGKDPEKDKDVEKEKDPPEDKEQGGNEDEKKGKGSKKRGD